MSVYPLHHLLPLALPPQLLEYLGKGKSIVDVGLAQARHPLSTRSHYFEVEIVDPGEKCYIALGLARKVGTRALESCSALGLLEWGPEALGEIGEQGGRLWREKGLYPSMVVCVRCGRVRTPHDPQPDRGS